MKKVNIMGILYTILYLLLGAYCGSMIDVLLDAKVSFLVAITYIVLVIVLSFFLVPLIHEAGHLVLGLLTGYDFVSFRIGSFTLIKIDNKLVRKKFNIAGTGGQCIMAYKETDKPEDIPYFWYHFGGVFFNFLTSIILLTIVFFIKNPFVNIAATFIAMLSFVLGLINIVPSKNAGIGNDGYNIKILRKSIPDRTAIYKTLLINAKQYQGIKLEDIEKKYLMFSELEKNSSFGIGLKLIEANLSMNKHDFIKMEEQLQCILESEEILGLHKNECRCELLFAMIMNKASKKEIDRIYNKELQKYIKATKTTYIMRRRLLYAYYLIVEKNKEKAEKELIATKKLEKLYPAKGEYLSEMELMNFIQKKYDI